MTILSDLGLILIISALCFGAYFIGCLIWDCVKRPEYFIWNMK